MGSQCEVRDGIKSGVHAQSLRQTARIKAKCLVGVWRVELVSERPKQGVQVRIFRIFLNQLF